MGQHPHGRSRPCCTPRTYDFENRPAGGLFTGSFEPLLPQQDSPLSETALPRRMIWDSVT